MNTTTRRSLVALAGASALVGLGASARPTRNPAGPLFSCTAMIGTPEIIPMESDIPFDQAYIDTTIPYQTSALVLTEAAIDDLEDERVIPIAERILESHPENIEQLREMREELYGDPEPGESSEEKMMLAMGGVESCADQSHMDFMDDEWVLETFEKQDDPYFAYVSMIVLLLEMENHQHMVGVQLAENDELREFSERLLEEKTDQIEVLKEVRGELFTRY
jgi:uncharacterized protein (DUF305 family)